MTLKTYSVMASYTAEYLGWITVVAESKEEAIKRFNVDRWERDPADELSLGVYELLYPIDDTYQIIEIEVD